MPQTSICRICLVTGVRMFNIAGTPLQAMYEKITEAELLENMKPVAACYICHAQLRRSLDFMLRAVKADEALTDFLMNNKLSVKSVGRIDRTLYKLHHSFNTKLEVFDNTMAMPDDEPKVKKEATFEFVADDHHMDYDDHSDFLPLHEPEVQVDEKTVIVQPEVEYLQIEFMKEERNSPVSDADDNRDADSEDERPLTKIKAVKRKREDGEWRPKKTPAEKKPVKKAGRAQKPTVNGRARGNGKTKSRRILCVNCNIRLNTLRHYTAFDLDARSVALLASWIYPQQMDENHRICEACRDILISTVNANLEQGLPDIEQFGPSKKGHLHICRLCGVSIATRQSDKILRDNPNELHQAMIDIIKNRVAPRQVTESDKVCHACWLRTQREVRRMNRDSGRVQQPAIHALDQEEPSEINEARSDRVEEELVTQEEQEVNEARFDRVNELVTQEEHFEMDEARSDRVKEEPDTQEEHVEIDEERTDCVEYEPDTQEEHLEMDEERSDCVEDEPDTQEEPSEVDEARSDRVKEEPDTQEEHSEMDEERSDCVEDETDTHEEHLEMDEARSDRVKEEPVTQEKHSEEDEDDGWTKTDGVKDEPYTDE